MSETHRWVIVGYETGPNGPTVSLGLRKRGCRVCDRTANHRGPHVRQVVIGDGHGMPSPGDRVFYEVEEERA